MKIVFRIYSSKLYLLVFLLFISCNAGGISSKSSGSSSAEYDGNTNKTVENLRQELANYIKDKDARIGIAIIINRKDTIEVNGKKEFPMLSVYKFPQAIFLADCIAGNGKALSDTIDISANEILTDTWSPLRDKYGVKDLRIPLIQLLEFSLQQSDNNACDILFRIAGGPAKVEKYIHNLGFKDITIINTEAEMHVDNYLCYQNRTSPLEMASLFDKFASEWRFKNKELQAIDSLIRNCSTGKDRLAYPFENSDIIFGHKTGTGDINSQGRIIAVNDAGYVELPNKTTYSIAVFIADSGYTLERTSSLIAEISAIVYKYLK